MSGSLAVGCLVALGSLFSWLVGGWVRGTVFDSLGAWLVA